MIGHSATACRSSDALFEQILEEITARIQAGELVDLEACVAEHPEYADQLQKLLPAMQVLVAFGASQTANTSPPPATGERLGEGAQSGILGDFRIRRELGRGGMGVVYEAEQISIGRAVALKVLPFASMLDDRRLARFRNEVRAAGQLHHSNIVPVYAVGSDRGVHFYAMQLVAGQSLAQVVAQLQNKSSSGVEQQRSSYATTPPLHSCAADTAPVAALSTLRTTQPAEFFRTVAQLAIQAAEALEHAHSCGIVHRDIKPSNLLLDQRGTLWLTDFGLASIESDANLTMTGDLLGTLRYMSPEQTQGSRVVLDHRTDIYSLGATLYELLTLRPAFDAANRAELLRQINDQEPQAPRRINPAIPADLETIILKAISKDAASRYATAQHMADDLRRYLDNKPIEARRPTIIDRAAKWSRRHVAMISVAAAALAVVTTACLVAALLTFGAYKSEAQQRAAAEGNLVVAANAIDRVLANAAATRYDAGDLPAAENLAASAVGFYEELLKRSNAPELRFRAALAYKRICSVWGLLDRQEKAEQAAQRSLVLLDSLVAEFPENRDYLQARAHAHSTIAGRLCLRYQFVAAIEQYHLSEIDFEDLVKRYPEEPMYQAGLAGAVGCPGDIYTMMQRWDDAEQAYQRAEAVFDRMPPAFYAKLPDAVTRYAGLLSNWSILCTERGDLDRATKLLERAISLQRDSLKQWPTNPIARDFLYKHLDALAETQVRAGQHAAAAATVETLVQEFPDRLSAYHRGAEVLLACAALAENTPSPSGGGSGRGSEVGKETASIYRQRARQLVALAHKAPERTPHALERFAWFLLTCDDHSFRDSERALELAQTAVKDAPERCDIQRTLALAYYRNGNWQAADVAVQKSIKLSRDDKSLAYDWLLLSMIGAQQGRTDEARQWHTKAEDWIAKNDPSHEDDNLFRLATETSELQIQLGNER